MYFGYYDIKELFKSHAYAFFTGPYNVNIFGIRRSLSVDEFNDIIGVAYTDDFGNPVCLGFTGTTKPGLYYLKNKLGNVNGTFILQPGQYRGCWHFGKHNGQYDALRQRKPNAFTGWRDNDSDGELDMHGPLYTDATGVNLHTTSFKNEIRKVGAYSAGCQVIQHHMDFDIMMSVLRRSAARYGDVFSYTLFQL